MEDRVVSKSSSSPVHCSDTSLAILLVRLALALDPIPGAGPSSQELAAREARQAPSALHRSVFVEHRKAAHFDLDLPPPLFETLGSAALARTRGGGPASPPPGADEGRCDGAPLPCFPSHAVRRTSIWYAPSCRTAAPRCKSALTTPGLAGVILTFAVTLHIRNSINPVIQAGVSSVWTYLCEAHHRAAEASEPLLHPSPARHPRLLETCEVRGSHHGAPPSRVRGRAHCYRSSLLTTSLLAHTSAF